MIIIDCSEYGPVAPYITTAEDLSGILDFAQHIIDSNTTEWIEKWLDNWEMALAWDSVMSDSIGDPWYGRCLLVQAVYGLQGVRVPKTQVISN